MGAVWRHGCLLVSDHGMRLGNCPVQRWQLRTCRGPGSFCLWRSLTQISSTPGNVLRFVLPLVSRVLGIKASFPGPKQCPLWGSGHVIHRAERLGASTLFVLQNELLEAAVIDPCPPLSTDLKLQSKVVRSEVKLCRRNKVPVPSGSQQLRWLVLWQFGTI